MTLRRREATMIEPVIKYLRRRGYRRSQVEVPFFEHRIDVYAARTSGETVAVELKLRKWQRALQQGLLYQLCADLTYVVLPKSVLPRVALEGFAHAGIGLICVDDQDRCRCVLEAQQSHVLRAHYRQTYRDMLSQVQP